MVAIRKGISLRQERLRDIDAREDLLDAAFGEARHSKSSQRLREGRLPADGLSFVACDGPRVVGTVRLWHIDCGDHPALLLGPLAVAADCRSRGIGKALIGKAVREARRRGHRAIVLVGDASYYGRFGFTADKTAALVMPGAYEQHRLLALSLTPGALDSAHGTITAGGAKLPAALTGDGNGRNAALAGPAIKAA
ncbi:MAG TPA: N-acetyltransferase [Pseudolabrys sp.]|nr:N-acetyltransferase [Pseudolabrys sp.]